MFPSLHLNYSIHWISSPDLRLYCFSTVSQTGKLCSRTLLKHTNAAFLSNSLQKSAAFVSCWIPSQFSVPQGKWWSICFTHWDGDQVCASALEERDGAREREFVPHQASWETPRLCQMTVHDVQRRVCCVCVNTTRCVCFFYSFIFVREQGVEWRGGGWRGRPTKLVYHQLCSGSRLPPASVQYFFQLSPPNGGSGRFYGTTLGRLLWPDPEHLALCGLNVLWLWTLYLSIGTVSQEPTPTSLSPALIITPA